MSRSRRRARSRRRSKRRSSPRRYRGMLAPHKFVDGYLRALKADVNQSFLYREWNSSENRHIENTYTLQEFCKRKVPPLHSAFVERRKEDDAIWKEMFSKLQRAKSFDEFNTSELCYALFIYERVRFERLLGLTIVQDVQHKIVMELIDDHYENDFSKSNAVRAAAFVFEKILNQLDGGLSYSSEKLSNITVKERCIMYMQRVCFLMSSLQNFHDIPIIHAWLMDATRNLDRALSKIAETWNMTDVQSRLQQRSQEGQGVNPSEYANGLQSMLTPSGRANLVRVQQSPHRARTLSWNPFGQKQVTA